MPSTTPARGTRSGARRLVRTGKTIARDVLAARRARVRAPGRGNPTAGAHRPRRPRARSPAASRRGSRRGGRSDASSRAGRRRSDPRGATSARRTGRPAAPRELRGEERLDARSLLGAEAAADELRDHADAAPAASPKRVASSRARVEHALRRDPGREPVAVPAAQPRRAARAASGRGRASRRSARRALRRLRSPRPGRRGRSSRGSSVKRCSSSPASRSSANGQRLEPERRAPRRPRPARRACRPRRRDRRAGPVRLGGEDVLAAHRERSVRPEHRTDARDGAGRLDVEARHAAAGDRRAHDRALRACPGAKRRRCSGPRRSSAAARPGAWRACRRRRARRFRARSRRRRPRRRAPRRPRSAPPSRVACGRTSASCGLLPRRAEDRPLDLRVGAAAADVAREGRADLRPRRLRVRLQQGCRRHDLARCAEPALERILGDERLLERRSARVRAPRS